VPIRVIDVSTAGGAVAGAVPRATVRFEQTGINLRVTPHVTANRQVLMEVHAERSNGESPASVDIASTFPDAAGGQPDPGQRRGTAVIGGPHGDGGQR